MAKKVRTTNRKKNRKLRNTKRKLGTKRYKGGGNLGENDLKGKYKQMLTGDEESLAILNGIKLVLMNLGQKVASRNLNNFIIKMKENINENNVEDLKNKLKLVFDEIKKYETLETNSAYKSKALLKAQEINAELAK